MRHTAAVFLILLGIGGFAATTHALDSDTVQGNGKQLKGDVEQKAGQVLGNQSLQARGQSDQSQGALESAWGKVKDAARDVTGAIEAKFGGNK